MEGVSVSTSAVTTLAPTALQSMTPARLDDLYSHVLPGMQEESAARLNELLDGAHRSSDHI